MVTQEQFDKIFEKHRIKLIKISALFQLALLLIHIFFDDTFPMDPITLMFLFVSLNMGFALAFNLLKDVITDIISTNEESKNN